MTETTVAAAAAAAAAASAAAAAAAATAIAVVILYEKYLKRFGIVLVQKGLVAHVDRLLIVSHFDSWLERPWQGHPAKAMRAELPQ